MIEDKSSTDLRKYLGLLLFRDAVLEKEVEFLNCFLESEVAEILVEQVTSIGGVNKLEDAPIVLRNKTLNDSYLKTLMLIFVEASEVEVGGGE